MVSAMAVTGFVVRGLDVFQEIQKRMVESLQQERDRAKQAAFNAQIAARKTAENWTDTLVSISDQIAELENVDGILLYIIDRARDLLNADFMGLALIKGDFPNLTLKCYALPDQVEMVNKRVLIKNPLLLQLLNGQASFCSSPLELDENLRDACYYTDQSAGALAAAPLKMDAYTVGALWVPDSSARRFPRQI